MKIIRNLKSIFLSLIVLSFISIFGCMSVKPTASKTDGSLYETFYLGNRGTQYFIKPLLFESEKEELKIDFTFRPSENTGNLVTTNYTIVSAEKIEKVDTMILKNKTQIVKCTDNKKLYSEIKNSKRVCRFSAKIQLEKLNQIMANPAWSIQVVTKDTTMYYQASGRTKKSITKLQEDLFETLN